MSEIFSLRVVETATIPVSFSTMISKVYLFFYSWGVVLITNAIIRIIIVVQKTFTSNRTNNVSAEARPDDREQISLFIAVVSSPPYIFKASPEPGEIVQIFSKKFSKIVHEIYILYAIFSPI